MLTKLIYQLMKFKTTEESYHVVKFTLEWSNIWAGPHFFFFFFQDTGQTIDFAANGFTLFHLSACCSNVPKNKQGTSKKQGLRRPQATAAGSVTTDRSLTSKWKKSDVQTEEMHLDTFFGTQGYKTPLDWAFDLQREWQDSPCSASDRLASIVVFWWKSQRFCVPCTHRPSSFLVGEGKKSKWSSTYMRHYHVYKTEKNGRDFYGPVHTALCALVVCWTTKGREGGQWAAISLLFNQMRRELAS